MENLNAEQVKKALERDIRISIDLNYECPRITYSKLREALALINSQEQEKEKLGFLISELEKEKRELWEERNRIYNDLQDWKSIAEGYQKMFEDCAVDRAKLTEENERLNKYLDEHFPKCIYQYDGEVQEYCVLSPCGQFKTVAEFQKQIEANTVRKMSALLNAQIDEITTSRIELRAFPFAALLAERMKVIVADTAKKVEEGSV